MKSGLLLIILMLSAGAACAAGQTATRPRSQAHAAPSADMTASDATDPDAQICKRRQVLGSRFPVLVCHTAEQWNDMDVATRRYMRQFDQQGIPVGAEGQDQLSGP